LLASRAVEPAPAVPAKMRLAPTGQRGKSCRRDLRSAECRLHRSMKRAHLASEDSIRDSICRSDAAVPWVAMLGLALLELRPVALRHSTTTSKTLRADYPTPEP